MERGNRHGAVIAAAPSRRQVIAAMLAGFAGACAPRPDAGAITMWAQSTEGENAPILLPPFTARSGWRVDVQALPWTAAHAKILTAFAGGAMPDLMMVSNGWVAELAMLGAIAPLPPALAADQFASVLGSVMTPDGHRALPWVVNTQVQYFRRDLLAEVGHDVPPPDWAGWMRMARALKRRRSDSWPALMLLDWPEHLFGYAAQQPEPLLRDRDTRGNFSSAGFRAALAHYRSIFDEGLAPPVVGTEIGDRAASFTSGWVAILPGAAELVGDFRNRGLPRERWGAAMMPGPAGPATGPVAGSSLVVAARARDPARAWSLAAFLCDPATQQRFHAMTGDLPSRPSAWAAPALRDEAVAQVFARQLARGVAPPRVPEWARIQTEVQLVAERMVRERIDIDVAAREMDERVDRILAKRRWLLDRGLVA